MTTQPISQRGHEVDRNRFGDAQPRAEQLECVAVAPAARAPVDVPRQERGIGRRELAVECGRQQADRFTTPHRLPRSLRRGTTQRAASAREPLGS